MVLGLLLARVGLSVTVLESQPDFDRDFRGDTLHASTLEMLNQIGLADRVLELPHVKLREMSLNAGDRSFQLADFGRLPSPYPYIAIMPQADFLEFIASEASRHPGFSCLTNAAVVDIEQSDGRVVGVRYRRAGMEQKLRANLVVAADGRFSRLRKLAGLTAEERAAPMDVCWFRLPRRDEDGFEAGGFFIGHGRMLICIPRVGEWQIGYVFPKGDFHEVRERGITQFRADIASTVPWLADRSAGIEDFSDVHLLNVKADCLPVWHKNGLLLIGDAAHVMSPVGGVGINAAISDAVEAANVLGYEGVTPLLAAGPPEESVLARIQQRRARPTRIIQAVQSRVQTLLVERALSGDAFEIPAPARILFRTPGLRQLPIRIFALGVSRTRLSV
jgi:2-polyprenyl-6-methoxyphenol hydroxylase-like FAD-dependent oxidoreductase